MNMLAKKTCVPCKGGTPPLTAEQIEPLRKQVRNWDVVENHHIRKQLKFPDFLQALNFVNSVAAIAEREDHHPDICFGWGRVEITIWTHKINGLTESDFILAAKIDEVSP